MLALRRKHRAFGRGTLRFLFPGNRKILAYLREYEDEHILCVANLSRARKRWNSTWPRSTAECRWK